MKISKELKTGIVTIFAIALMVTGINFLKGNSFFGGDDIYYAYFPNSGQLVPSSNVTLNGVVVGKVLKVEYVPSQPAERCVKISFSIQNDEVKIPKGSVIQVGALDLFSKGMLIDVSANLAKGFYKPGDVIPGEMAVDMFGQVKSFADPLSKKVQTALVSVDKMVNSLNAFWDKTATSEIEQSFSVLKLTIKRFGNVAVNIEDLVQDEKIKLANILTNVESISFNLKKSNDQISAILGNAKTITDDLVTADFKKVIGNANETLKNLNLILATAEKGEGSLGKLLKDEKLYNELITTNKDLQNLVVDIQMHPERFIHFSVFGAKTKGVPLSQREELKLRQLLDSVPN